MTSEEFRRKQRNNSIACVVVVLGAIAVTGVFAALLAKLIEMMSSVWIALALAAGLGVGGLGLIFYGLWRGLALAEKRHPRLYCQNCKQVAFDISSSNAGICYFCTARLHEPLENQSDAPFEPLERGTVETLLAMFEKRKSRLFGILAAVTVVAVVLLNIHDFIYDMDNEPLLKISLGILAVVGLSSLAIVVWSPKKYRLACPACKRNLMIHEKTGICFNCGKVAVVPQKKKADTAFEKTNFSAVALILLPIFPWWMKDAGVGFAGRATALFFLVAASACLILRSQASKEPVGGNTPPA